MNNDHYLHFLRYALNDDAPIPDDITRIDWQKLKRFANEHAVVGIYWQGIRRLGQETPNKPTDDDVMAWMALVTKIQRRNRFMDERTGFIARTFRSEGFPNIILKGQGNATYYPEPSLRTSGDVDIWLRGSRGDITRYVQHHCPKERPIYLHIAFKAVKDVEVEVHYMPSYLNNPFCNRRLQRFFQQQWDNQQADSRQPTADGARYPTTRFNLVYQLCHILHHVFDEGIGLRQLIDYYYLLLNATPADTDGLVRQLSSYNMLGFAQAVLWIEQHILGLPGQYLFTTPDERRGRVLLADILHGGNFGKYNDDYQHASRRRIYPKRAWKKLCHSISLVRYFPSEALWEPLFRIWHFFWRLRH